MDLLAGFALLMVTTSNAEGGNKLVHRGAFLFFGMDDVFQVCYFCSISTNDKMKLCSNTKKEVLFQTVSLVFA